MNWQIFFSAAIVFSIIVIALFVYFLICKKNKGTRISNDKVLNIIGFIALAILSPIILKLFENAIKTMSPGIGIMISILGIVLIMTNNTQLNDEFILNKGKERNVIITLGLITLVIGILLLAISKFII